MSVLLRYTDSDCPFGIFKLFFRRSNSSILNRDMDINCILCQVISLKRFLLNNIVLHCTVLSFSKFLNSHCISATLPQTKIQCYGYGVSRHFNISVIWLRLVLLVGETRVPRENHLPVASHWQTLSHKVVLSKPRLSGILTSNVTGDRQWLHR